MSRLLALVLALVSGAAANDACPGGDLPWVHAWAEVEVAFTSTSCADVNAEMLKRISNTEPFGWVDPHNGGKYTATTSTATNVAGTRATANGKYTDKWGFIFEAIGFKSGAFHRVLIFVCFRSQYS